MIKGLIFDFDDTISYRRQGAYRAYKEFFKKYFPDYDYEGMEYEAILQAMLIYEANGYINNEERIKPFVRRYGLDESLIDEYCSFIENNYCDYVVKRNGIDEVLEELKEAGYKLAMLTNGRTETQRRKIRVTDIEKHFDVVIVSGEIGIRKPDPEAFSITAQKLGLKNEECAYVGDNFINDMLGADRAGMLPIWIQPNDEYPSDYRKLIRINDIRKLKKAVDELNKQ